LFDSWSIWLINLFDFYLFTLFFIFFSRKKGVRDFIHVVDLALGHLAALDRFKQSDNTGCEVYNLGTGTGYHFSLSLSTISYEKRNEESNYHNSLSINIHSSNKKKKILCLRNDCCNG